MTTPANRMATHRVTSTHANPTATEIHEPREPSTRCTNSIEATIAPGPASSGVPSGTMATLTLPLGASGSSSLPVSSSIATSRSSSPPEPCSAGSEMCM